MKNRKERKKEFIHALAVYMVEDQAQKSIGLEMGNRSSKEWAELRGLTPLHGYPTVQEAIEVLTEFLG